MENVKSGLYYVIPSQVFEDKRLEPSEIIFYALLSGLAFSDGYCYAGDEYLAGRCDCSARQIQHMLEKLESLGYVHRDTKKEGMKWKRKIFITHSSKNVYETKHSSGSSGSTVPDRVEAHCDIVSKENIVSKNIVCYPLPDEEKKEALEIGQEALSLPQEVTKKTPDGKEISISLNDVLLNAIKKRRSWNTKQIHEAWKILAEYDGPIRDPHHFIEGTIKNLNNAKISEHLSKQGKLCSNEEIMKYKDSKENSSVEDMKEQRSLQWYLDQENLKK